jgi:hypothetical protein
VFFRVKVTADNSHDRAVEIKILFQANKIDVLTTALIWTDWCWQLEYRPSVAVRPSNYSNYRISLDDLESKRLDK